MAEDDEQQRSGEGSGGHEERGSRRSERSSRERNGSSQGSGVPLPSVQAIGWAFVLLILAGYFAWMIVEMGGHAVTRAWPMLGVFVAAIAGVLAATLGLAIGRRGRSD